MARYVNHGALDAALSGLDWVIETRLDVGAVVDLIYAKQSRGKIRWIDAVVGMALYTGALGETRSSVS